MLRLFQRWTFQFCLIKTGIVSAKPESENQKSPAAQLASLLKEIDFAAYAKRNHANSGHTAIVRVIRDV